MSIFFRLTKFSIVFLVLLCALAAYALGLSLEKAPSFQWTHFILFCLGTYGLASGSLAFNQLQEVELDRKMKRTQLRPLVNGSLHPAYAWLLSFLLIAIGLICLWHVNLTAFFFGLLTIFLYNIFYTFFWKPKWAFAAVPGALPGALPVVIGYTAIHPNLFNSNILYLFLVLFLWQMPHFWLLALRFASDYKNASIPVLPTVIGEERTILHIGLYLFTYLALVLLSPLFVYAGWFYLLGTLPLVFKVMWEYSRFAFYKDSRAKRWLPCFLWTNLSLLVFIWVPVLDKFLHSLLLS